MHRGIIEVSSVVDEGTTVTVRIPLNYIVQKNQKKQKKGGKK